jgi:hypothetical protein
MRFSRRSSIFIAVCLGLLFPIAVFAQVATILGAAEVAKIAPTSVQLIGHNVTLQMRNATAVRFEGKQTVVAAIQDGTGYGSEVAAQYEGVLIANLPIRIGDRELGPGTYGFGFSKMGGMNLFNQNGKPLFSVDTVHDDRMAAPRPLAMVKGGDGVRLYRGKDYVILSAQ